MNTRTKKERWAMPISLFSFMWWMEILDEPNFCGAKIQAPWQTSFHRRRTDYSCNGAEFKVSPLGLRQTVSLCWLVAIIKPF